MYGLNIIVTIHRDPPSPRTPPNSPEILPPKPPSPLVAVARTRTPIPSDSPLLSKVRPDPILKRIRSFNKSLKKASSFRQNRGKASEQVREGSQVSMTISLTFWLTSEKRRRNISYVAGGEKGLSDTADKKGSHI